MSYIDFVTSVHKATKRNYLERMTEKKPEIIKLAKKYDFDYWDGSRETGYGGFYYDGRWRPVAERIAEYYNLKPYSRVLDVGCGKGFLVYELMQVVPGMKVNGIDISAYAIEHAKEEVKDYVIFGVAQNLPYKSDFFDLVISLTTLHNLYLYDFKKAIQEIERVKKKDSYITVEAYRNEREKFNMMCWVLTGESFFHVKEWEFLFKEFGYTGDHGFIFFSD